MPRPRKLPEHVCKQCGNIFRPDYAAQLYCDRACYENRGYPRIDALTDINLGKEIAAAKRERATAPPYRYWHRQRQT